MKNKFIISLFVSLSLLFPTMIFGGGEQFEKDVRQELSKEEQSKLTTLCSVGIPIFRQDHQQYPESEYYTRRLAKVLEVCGKHLNNQQFIEESKQLNALYHKQLNERSIRQQTK